MTAAEQQCAVCHEFFIDVVGHARVEHTPAERVAAAAQYRCPVCRQRLASEESAASPRHQQSQRHLDAASLLAMVDREAS